MRHISLYLAAIVLVFAACKDSDDKKTDKIAFDANFPKLEDSTFYRWIRNYDTLVMDKKVDANSIVRFIQLGTYSHSKPLLKSSKHIKFCVAAKTIDTAAVVVILEVIAVNGQRRLYEMPKMYGKSDEQTGFCPPPAPCYLTPVE